MKRLTITLTHDIPDGPDDENVDQVVDRVVHQVHKGIGVYPSETLLLHMGRGRAAALAGKTGEELAVAKKEQDELEAHFEKRVVNVLLDMWNGAQITLDGASLR